MSAEILHAGHISFLKKARSLAENVFLIVGLLSDDDLTDAKRSPVCCLNDRFEVVSQCRLVDEVIAPAPRWITDNFIKFHNIDFVVHGDDWTPLLDFAYKDAIRMGIMKKVPYTKGISTTQILEKFMAYKEFGYKL